MCGSVAGDPGYMSEGAALASSKGNAYKGKIVFTDMGAASLDGGLATPPDLGSQFFPYSYYKGARIHTNSWGGYAIIHRLVDGASG